MNRRMRLNIGGPKGNALVIMATAVKLGRSMGMTSDEANSIPAKMRGDTFVALGGDGNDYEGLLRVFLDEFPFVELYALHDIGLPEDLCTIDPEPEIIEL